jgi:hypothetical protein
VEENANTGLFWRLGLMGTFLDTKRSFRTKFCDPSLLMSKWGRREGQGVRRAQGWEAGEGDAQTKRKYQETARCADTLNEKFGLYFKTMGEVLERDDRKYRKITYEEREKLIAMVVEERKKIADAARRLDINPSTARIIIQNFREEGRIYEKKSDRMARRKRCDQTCDCSRSEPSPLPPLHSKLLPPFSLLPQASNLNQMFPCMFPGGLLLCDFNYLCQ